VTTSTEVIVQRRSVDYPISVPIVVETIHNSNVVRNKQLINNVRSDQQLQQQHINCVAAPNDLKRVRAPANIGTGKVARLCARTQQHHEACVPAERGERAQRATPTPAKAKVARLCAQSPHHEVCVAEGGEECAVRAQHMSTHTQPGAQATTLANSPINIGMLNSKLDKYARINSDTSEELRDGFTKGFKLGYLGPRVLQKSKNLVSVAGCDQ
jgi:hypothetical protein